MILAEHVTAHLASNRVQQC